MEMGRGGKGGGGLAGGEGGYHLLLNGLYTATLQTFGHILW